MKTLADFKRDVANRKIKFEMIEHFGKTGDEIPARCRGIRTVQSSNTVGATLVTVDGLTSSLDFPPAKLIEYDGKSLVIYDRGERELTEQEMEILAEWQKLENEYYEKNPHGNAYWKKQQFFENCPCPWLNGFKPVQGKRFY